ncbi:MAG TPA: hypothetical protein VMH27_09290 [Puia sp.]|nr:hypothetical protein [Puia sp.]
MNQSMQRAIQHLFQVTSLEAVSLEHLETLVEEYPCFGFGHYLLSQKLRVENSDRFLPATQRTNLYFPNPFWLQWMLDNTSGPVKPSAEVAAGDEGIVVEEPEFAPREAWPEMETVEAPAETDTFQPDPGAPASASELLFESIEHAKSLRESLQKINEDFQSHNGQETAQPAPAEEPIQDEEPPFVLDETDRSPETSEATPVAEPVNAETAPIAEATPVAESAPIVAENTPLFEPLHTIDYFASQGIKLTLDENPTDPLGRQLKSFTDWLRTMRRLPQQGREIIPDRVAEQTVQNFAAHSIEGKEPVTETMAEVLVKQGMPERARVVYEKLSLLNPDKSAYFAAKIEQLNSH